MRLEKRKGIKASTRGESKNEVETCKYPIDNLDGVKFVKQKFTGEWCKSLWCRSMCNQWNCCHSTSIEPAWYGHSPAQESTAKHKVLTQSMTQPHMGRVHPWRNLSDNKAEACVVAAGTWWSAENPGTREACLCVFIHYWHCKETGIPFGFEWTLGLDAPVQQARL